MALDVASFKNHFKFSSRSSKLKQPFLLTEKSPNMTTETKSENGWVSELYSVNNPTDELKYYEETAAVYENNLKGLNYRAPDFCFVALKKYEEESGMFYNFEFCTFSCC